MSDTFYKCLNKNACVKEDLNGNKSKCLKGYRGALCQACEYGYSRTGENSCSKCAEQTKSIIFLSLIIAGGLSLIFGLTYTNLMGAYKEESVTSVYFKILTNYMQIIAITISFNLGWPDIVLEMFKVQGMASGATTRVYSIDCYLSQEHHPFYAKLILINLIPIATSITTVLFFLIKSLFSKTEYLKSKIVGSIVVQIFFFQSNIIQMNFSIFNCMKISNGESYMYKEMSIKCWSDKHFFYTFALALPGIGLWCIVIPMVLLISLKNDHLGLGNINEKLKYGFLYKGYKDDKFFWEFLIYFRKLGIISCSVFLNIYSNYIQALCTFVFILFGYIIQLRYKPYNHDQLNQMELRSIIVSAVTISYFKF